MFQGLVIIYITLRLSLIFTVFNLTHQPLSAPYTEVADSCPLEVVKESVEKNVN